MLERLKKTKLFIFFDKIFNDEVTKEDYYWHWFLAIANIFLFGIALVEIFFAWHYANFEHEIHVIEMIFGTIFLLELIMRFIIICSFKDVYWNWYLYLNILVIISLLAPWFFGNLAILRLVRSLKIIKIYKNIKHTKQIKVKLKK